MGLEKVIAVLQNLDGDNFLLNFLVSSVALNHCI
jgi:hypothetical protein